jgi:spermidine/putrescine transport system substrate-binding protein
VKILIPLTIHKLYENLRRYLVVHVFSRHIAPYASQLFIYLVYRTLIIGLWLLLFSGVLYLLSAKENQEEAQASKVLRIFCWSDSFDPAYVERFEEATGAKVKFSYYDNNGELIVKLRLTQGRGYDIIVPSDVGVNILAREGLLQEIDHHKLPFFNQIDPLLLGHYYDPANRYSIPLEWSVVGLGYSSQYPLFATTPPDWKHIFDPRSIPKEGIAMMNEPREVIQIAAHYLFPEKASQESPNYSQEEINEIVTLLKRQRQRVHCYTDARADYLLATHNIPLAVTSSSYTWRTMLRYPHMHFHLPESGGFLNIENVALSAGCSNTDLAYQFINFIYSRESIQWHFKKFGYFPTLYIDEIISSISQEMLPEEMLNILKPNEQLFKRLNFLKSDLDELQAFELWAGIKSFGSD